MKIAFTGVSSTGKSTLSKLVADALNLPHIDEGTPLAFDWAEQHGLPIKTRDFYKQDVNDRFNFEVGMFNALSELEQKLAPAGFVADSACTDRLNYFFMQCSMNCADDVFDKMADEHFKTGKVYDIVFRLPAGVIPIEDNGWRFCRKNHIWSLDQTHKALCERAKSQYGIPMIEIPPHVTGLERRLNYVLAWVERLKS